MKKIFTLSVISIFCIFIYLLTLRGIYGNPQVGMIKNNLDQVTKPFELSPERDRYILILSLTQNKSFALTKELADAAYPDTGYYKGKYYIYFPPGISLLALPLFKLGSIYNLSQVGAYLTITIFAFLNIIFLYKISRKILKLSFWSSILVPLIFAFGSTSWSYAGTLYQHHVSTFLIISSFYFVWKFRKHTRWSWFWALLVWINFGYGIWVDYPNALLMLPVMIYFFLSSFTLNKMSNAIKISFQFLSIITSLVFIILIAIHGYYNYVNFGDWKRVSGSLIGVKKIEESQLLKTATGSATIAFLQEQKQLVNFFREDKIANGFYTLTVAIDRGLFLYSPIFILALLGILYSLRKKNLEIAILLSTIAVNFFLYSSWGDPWGGWAFGPRYLIPSMAILSIFIGVFLHEVKHKIISRIITFILFLYSSAVALLGALTTNQVPPKVEADYLHMKYNFFLNWDYFMHGKSSSFIFNQYASKYINLQQYFLLIWGVLIIIVIITLFILPLFEKHES